MDLCLLANNVRVSKYEIYCQIINICNIFSYFSLGNSWKIQFGIEDTIRKKGF